MVEVVASASGDWWLMKVNWRRSMIGMSMIRISR